MTTRFVGCLVGLLLACTADPDGGHDEHDAAKADAAQPDAAQPDAAQPDAAQPDACVLNACGQCGEAPAELCNGEDDDCDGEIDEGALNACGGCGLVPEEACNGVDDDCDGQTDEGLRNACGGCGAPPEEICDGADNDCDGQVDEGVRNACGACGPVPAEQCNGADDDCDGETDEGTLNACGACGAVPVEQCNGEDDDCDGQVDEALLNACGACGAVPVEVCNGRDDDCDGQADEALLNACGGCGPEPAEVCDERDNDCDGQTDEFVLNACGACGAVPEERCDEADNDCDGAIDEALPLNDCGVCGPLSAEVCNGLDDDCDGETDEGVERGVPNRDGEERCDGIDEDCDGAVDEGLAGVDVRHCGGCDVGCSRNNAEPQCLSGTCVVFRCEEGFIDLDLDASNGCEFQIPPAAALFVDGTWEGDEEGTAENPFRTIGAALAVAEENAQVFVAPATYEEDVDVNVVGVQVVSTAPLLAVLTGAVRVSGERAELNGFFVDGTGRNTGVTVQCPRGCSVVGCRVVAGGPLGSAYGISVIGGSSVSIRDNDVAGIRGRSGVNGCCLGVTRHGFGVQVGGGSVGARVVGNTITTVTGGSSNDGPHYGGGGAAYGIHLQMADSALAQGNLVSDLRAGTHRSGVGVKGPDAAGVYVAGGSAVEVVDNEVRDIVSGALFTGGYAGWAGGIWLSSAVGATVAGNVAERLRGHQGSDFSRWPGAAAGLYLHEVDGLVATGNRFSDVRGGAGWGPQRDGPGFGLRESGSRNLAVDASNTVYGTPIVFYDGGGEVVIGDLEVRGRMPTNHGAVVVRNADAVRLSRLRVGGFATTSLYRDLYEAVGVRVEGSLDVTVEDVVVTDVQGVSAAVGFEVVDVLRLAARGNAVRRVYGGATANGYGVRGAGLQNAEIAGLLVEDVQPGANGAEGVGVALGEGLRSAQVANATVADVPVGVRLDGGARAALVRDSVFTRVGVAVSGGAEGSPVQLRYSAFEAVEQETEGFVEADEETLLRAACVDPFSPDLALAFDAPCVDAGTPDPALCEAEPRPEGEACHLDMGHLGGTPEARFSAP